MGRPKLLLSWGPTTVLGSLLAQWNDLGVCDQAVVVAAGDHGVPGELDRLGRDAVGRIVNPEPALGMFRSIQEAARWPGWPPWITHVVVSLGDQPHVRTATLRAVLRFAADRPDRICQPSRAGRGRHPVVFPRAAFLELASAAGPSLRDHLASRQPPVQFCESGDAGLDADLDSPADYQRWQPGSPDRPLPEG